MFCQLQHYNNKGCDFRDLAALEVFCTHLLTTLPRLDGIVNNACQTIRRPPQYFAHLMAGERQPPPLLLAPILASKKQKKKER